MPHWSRTVEAEAWKSESLRESSHERPAADSALFSFSSCRRSRAKWRPREIWSGPGGLFKGWMCWWLFISIDSLTSWKGGLNSSARKCSYHRPWYRQSAGRERARRGARAGHLTALSCIVLTALFGSTCQGNHSYSIKSFSEKLVNHFPYQISSQEATVLWCIQRTFDVS